MSQEPILAKARRAGRILTAYLTDRAARLRFGARQRAGIVAAQREDKPIHGYRIAWHQATVRRLLLELRQASQEFEANHPWDAASVEDLQDVVQTLYKMVS